MDRNLKFSSLDLDGFGEGNEVHGSRYSSGFEDKNEKSKFSIDLKLGQFGNAGTHYSMDKMKVGSSASGPSKRGRAPSSSGTQAGTCLVDGCTSDLSSCREYHRRHKVCEVHSKTRVVLINGREQRFCQQCSRFHSLEEFDEGKRSCRKRLDGHNRRRRKPQQDRLLHCAEGFLPSHQGSNLLLFSRSNVHSPTSAVNCPWASSACYSGNQYPFLQGNGQGSHETCLNGLTTEMQGRNCVFSPLSSPQAQVSSAAGMNNMAHFYSFSEVQWQSSSFHNGNTDVTEPVDSIVVSSFSEANLNYQRTLRDRSQGALGTQASQALPFLWE